MVIMADVRKILVIFLIGILYAVFVQSVIEALYPSPDYEDYCASDYLYTPSFKTAEPVNCTPLAPLMCEKGGNVREVYSGNCAVSSYCDYCSRDLEQAQQERGMIVFIISAIMGLIAIAIGLMLPAHKNPINEWVGTGFLLGGLITLFTGTIMYYDDMTRILRP